MKRGDLSELIAHLDSSAETDKSFDDILKNLRDSYRFSPGFTEKVTNSLTLTIRHDFASDFTSRVNSLLTRVAITGVAAVIIMAISVFLSGGDLSFDSLLGLTNSTDESIICLLTGN